ncbi:MAG: hypothetical protein ACOCWQ_01360 [Nanoarchaeota archaeon]
MAMKKKAIFVTLDAVLALLAFATLSVIIYFMVSDHMEPEMIGVDGVFLGQTLLAADHAGVLISGITVPSQITAFLNDTLPSHYCGAMTIYEGGGSVVQYANKTGCLVAPEGFKMTAVRTFHDDLVPYVAQLEVWDS